jgi:hypothetical protein
VMTYAHLASVVPVYRLSAPLTAGPERLARAVRDTVSDHSTRQPERQMEVYA